jgi:hypothetical protein
MPLDPNTGEWERTFTNAKNAYENWMAEMSKLGEMYSSIVRDAYKPVERTMEKHKA